MSQATVTAKTGPGIQATAVVITDVVGINFDLNAGVLFISIVGTPSPQQFQLTGSNTITLTASGGVYTLTVS